MDTFAFMLRLRDLLGTRYRWEEERIPPKPLPPLAGLWLERTGHDDPTSWIHLVQPRFLHPVEVVAAESGAYPLRDETGGHDRGGLQRLIEARTSLAQACEILGGTLGVPPARVAYWFHLFTPFNTGTADPAMWHRRGWYPSLGFDTGIADWCRRKNCTVTEPPVYRPDFWSTYDLHH